MPIEIKQLEIRGKVLQGAADSNSVSRADFDLQHFQKKIVQECLEKVIAYFETKNDR